MSGMVIRAFNEGYDVGHYGPDGKWESFMDMLTHTAACHLLHMLNGGTLDSAQLVVITREKVHS